MSPEQRRAMLVAEVEDLNAVIEEHGMTVAGSKGQLVLNPALAARRAALEAIRKLDATTPPAPVDDPLESWLS